MLKQTEARHGLRHGGKILVDQLKIQGVERVYSVPGESFLAALDGLYESDIDTIVCRQEGGAAMMAEAHGKLTGQPGIAFVTRGPGATNASAGVHVAYQDSTPMILFIGQVARHQRDREAFQEVDYRQMFGPLAKWVAEIELTERIPEYISHAFHVAMSGRPGPVVLALPEDMLSAHAEVADAPKAAVPRMEVSPEAIDEILVALKNASRPLAIVGGGGWSAEAAHDLACFAEAYDLPVGASFRCQDYLDNRRPCYVGDIGIGINPKLAQRVREADLLLVLGARLGEMTTSGYSLVDIPQPAQGLIHVYPDPDELGRVYHPSLGIAARPPALLRKLAAATFSAPPAWARWRREARADYEAWHKTAETPGALKMENVIRYLSETLPDDAILTNGAGNYSAWLHRYFSYKRWRTQLAPTSGSMGYGLPAAVAAKLTHPERDVVCLAGDGCFQMSMQEFGTACQYGADIIVLVSNNGMYGTIRMHQERHYPGRVSGTTIVNPDFAALAQSYGAYGETVSRDEDFPAAFSRAKASGRPAILELQIDPKALSPRLVL
ncbi:thiamine pyrophosphate-binding protein [Chelativorans salis]|uniref:Thiamine pyrophosphate-binding protein n=1 Tax=Chelativorans salis TaxID=2978478 RepID=A0ABT2LNE7_9HYPH|nr:thiamine pyrophosphate-binding protein [Chelativorans sp. EGI FJ00035]MCT7374704.1 thiamine pyrophosphate-binding protein [Chelativorans sp. EGI FJ00035]